VDLSFGWKMNTLKSLLEEVNMNGCMSGGCDTKDPKIPIHN